MEANPADYKTAARLIAEAPNMTSPLTLWEWVEFMENNCHDSTRCIDTALHLKRSLPANSSLAASTFLAEYERQGQRTAEHIADAKRQADDVSKLLDTVKQATPHDPSCICEGTGMLWRERPSRVPGNPPVGEFYPCEKERKQEQSGDPRLAAAMAKHDPPEVRAEFQAQLDVILQARGYRPFGAEIMHYIKLLGGILNDLRRKHNAWPKDGRPKEAAPPPEHWWQLNDDTDPPEVRKAVGSWMREARAIAKMGGAPQPSAAERFKRNERWKREARQACSYGCDMAYWCPSEHRGSGIDPMTHGKRSRV